MADEHDRHAALAQSTDGREQVVDLVRGEGGSRLVHDQEPRARRERLRDLEQLPIGDAEASHRACPDRCRPRTPRGSARLSVRIARQSTRRPRLRGCRPAKTFSRDRQIRKDRRLLVHRDDPESVRCLRIADLDQLPSIRSRPRRPGRLPVRILTSVDLPAPFSPTSACTVPALDREADISERLNAAVALRQPAQLDEWRRLRRHQRVYPAGTPPSTLMMFPVDFALRGPARYAIASATSSG